MKKILFIIFLFNYFILSGCAKQPHLIIIGDIIRDYKSKCEIYTKFNPYKQNININIYNPTLSIIQIKIIEKTKCSDEKIIKEKIIYNSSKKQIHTTYFFSKIRKKCDSIKYCIVYSNNKFIYESPLY